MYFCSSKFVKNLSVIHNFWWIKFIKKLVVKNFNRQIFFYLSKISNRNIYQKFYFMHSENSIISKLIIDLSMKGRVPEAFRGPAICGDGSKPSTLLHGNCYGQSLSYRSLSHNALKNVLVHVCSENICIVSKCKSFISMLL